MVNGIHITRLEGLTQVVIERGSSDKGVDLEVCLKPQMINKNL